MTSQELQQSGIILFTQPGAAGRVFAYAPSNNSIGMGGPGQIHEITDPNTLSSLGVSIGSLPDISTVSNQLGLTQYANPDTQTGANYMYGVAGGANFDSNGFQNLVNQYASNAQSTGQQQSQEAASNSALGNNAYKGGFVNLLQQPPNPPTAPQTQADVVGGQSTQNQTNQSVSFPTQNLQPGQSGDQVKQLQQYLIQQGYQIKDGATGYYGPETQAAVTQFQQALGVDNSSGPGYWGPKTLAAIQGQSGQNNASGTQNQGGTNNTSTPDQNTTTGSNNTSSSSPTSYNTGNPTIDSLLTAMDGFLGRLAQNGTTINPNTTISPADAAQFMTMAQNNLSAFIPEATSEIAPYYQSQLQQAKQTFLTSVGYSTQQQQQLEQDLQKTYNQSLKDIGSTAADQGFAQSGARAKQESDLAYNTNRQIQQGRQSLAQGATQSAQQFASLYGGANVPSFNLPNAPEASGGSPLGTATGSQPLYSLSDSVYAGLTGSQQYQQTTDINTRAGALSSAFQQQQGVQQQRNLTL